MKFSLERKARLIFGLLSLSAFVVAFQNCSTPIDFSMLAAKSNGNGTGYDGKLYVNHGRCGTSTELALKGAILVSPDGSAVVTREDCADLIDVVPIAAGSMKSSLADSNVVIFDREIYDYYEEDVTKRKLTRFLCWMHPPTNQSITAEISGWYYGDALLLNATNPPLTGTVELSGGETTGNIQASETYLSSTNVNYSGADPAGNLFNLNFYSNTSMNYGTLSYKIAGRGALQVISSTECYLQAPNFP